MNVSFYLTSKCLISMQPPKTRHKFKISPISEPHEIVVLQTFFLFLLRLQNWSFQLQQENSWLLSTIWVLCMVSCSSSKKNVWNVNCKTIQIHWHYKRNGIFQQIYIDLTNWYNQMFKSGSPYCSIQSGFLIIHSTVRHNHMRINKCEIMLLRILGINHVPSWEHHPNDLQYFLSFSKAAYTLSFYCDILLRRTRWGENLWNSNF